MDPIFYHPLVVRACREFKVRFLHVFGSYAEGSFRPESDVDLIVEFDREGFSGAFEQYMGFKERLEEIFKCRVDLLVNQSFRNRIFQEEVDRTKKLVYAA